MKTFEIKITGNGTKNQIETRLHDIARQISLMEESELLEINDVAPFYEDDILCAEITPDNCSSLDRAMDKINVPQC